MKLRGIKQLAVIVLLITFFYRLPVNAEGNLTVTTECTKANTATIKIDVTDGVAIDGIEIYRADAKAGSYQLIHTIDKASQSDDYYDNDYYYGYNSQDYYDDEYYNESDYEFLDETGLMAYQTYYYQVKAYQLVKTEAVVNEMGEIITPENVQKNYIESIDTELLVLGAAPAVTYNKRYGKTSAKLKWNKVEGADGYFIYCVSDYDSKNNYVYTDVQDVSKYSLIQTITDPNVLSATFKKLKNGVTYTYILYAYKNINGMQVQSVPSEIKSITMDYYGYETEPYNKKVKRAFGSEKKKKKNFSTASKARKQMTTIRIKVWDFKSGKKGKKITKTKTLMVNKKLAPTIKAMFDEIYHSKEKQPIHSIGCYSYRPGEHMYGMAIDVNPNENYMIDGKKKLAGSYWKPKKDPYSIPQNSQFVKIMRRYGFYRGEWGDRKDYMHFSFFGT